MSKTVRYWCFRSKNWLKNGIKYPNIGNYTCADINSDFKIGSAKILAWKCSLQDKNLIRKFHTVWRYQNFCLERERVFYQRLRQNDLNLNNVTTENCAVVILICLLKLFKFKYVNFDLLTGVNDLLLLPYSFLSPEILFNRHSFEIVAAFLDGYRNL